MRIALLTRRFDPAGGGTERDLMVTAQALREAGHRVTVYAIEVRRPWKDGVVRRLWSPPLSRTLALMRFAYAAPVAARRDGADLVLSFARVVRADILRSGGGAHVSYVRAARQWRGRTGAAAMWISPYHRAQMRIERRGFTDPSLRRVIAVSNLVRDDLVQQFGLPPGKAITVYNGVDLERFRPAADSESRRVLRQALGLDPLAPVVIFVGNGFGRKGLGPMLDAWPALKSSASLMVVGIDRAAASYQRRAQRLGIGDRVLFLGARGDVSDLFHAADVLALPSFFEPFGNVVIEAMACGLPAMTSTHSGVAELMPPELHRFIVTNPSDPREIASRLDALIEARFDLTGVARATAERFTWKRYAEDLIRAIDSSATSP
jgi:UDP-glucose:(heptosyl)LPS alpha-1,3-glucosyltransferase